MSPSYGDRSSDAQIDEAIFAYLSTANSHWRKVAMVVWKAADLLGVDGDKNYKLIARRIQILADDDRLESKGDLENWHYSEVRRPWAN